MGSLAGKAQTDEEPLPWQRVINAQGKVSTHKLGFGDMQERLLEAEGVRFDPAGRCDLARLQWWPEEEGRDAPPEAPHAGRLSSAFAPASSSSELQAPQSGHFPSHFAVWYPHAWQV